MKATLQIGIVSALLTGLAAGAFAQSQVNLDNLYLGADSTNSSATTNGMFWLSTGGTTALINQDFNAAFYGGTNATNLIPIDTFLLSNGTAVGDNAGGPGTFADPTGAGRTITNGRVRRSSA